MRKYLSFLAAAALVACGGSETGGSGTSTSTSSSSGAGGSGSGSGGAGGAATGGGGSGGGGITEVAGEATTVNDCAPDDGKAFTINIGLPEKTCFATPSGPLLRLSFYSHVDSPAGNSWTFGGGEAQGIYQPDSKDPSNIVSVSIGSLLINSWDMFGASGTYDVVLINGTHLVGTFVALGCLQEPALCG